MSEPKSGLESAVSPTPPAAAPAPGDVSFLSSVEAITSQLANAADAQFAIWKMKLVRRIMLLAAAFLAMAACLTLIVYGFVLLDKTFDYALQNTGIAAWFSPLVRGCLYILTPTILAWWQSRRLAA